MTIEIYQSESGFDKPQNEMCERKKGVFLFVYLFLFLFSILQAAEMQKVMDFHICLPGKCVLQYLNVLTKQLVGMTFAELLGNNNWIIPWRSQRDCCWF